MFPFDGVTMITNLVITMEVAMETTLCTSRPGQDGRHFGIFEYNFLNGNILISIKI